jgi:hypothetical protein
MDSLVKTKALILLAPSSGGGGTNGSYFALFRRDTDFILMNIAVPETYGKEWKERRYPLPSFHHPVTIVPLVEGRGPFSSFMAHPIAERARAYASSGMSERHIFVFPQLSMRSTIK